MLSKKDSQKKTVKIEAWLHEYLDQQGRRGETFTRIIWRLITLKEMTKEEVKEMKDAKKGYEDSTDK